MTEPHVSQRRYSDEAVEQLLGNLLRAGVLFAASVVILGGVFFVLHNAGQPAGHHVFAGEPAELRSIVGIVAGAWHLQARAVVQLGLLFLIATPVARVALSLVAFALQRDRMYVLITAIVLGLLLFSLLGG